jgi:pre-mRNA-splicing factor ATP-dependent RNA helicase DHX38/PRP16
MTPARPGCGGVAQGLSGAGETPLRDPRASAAPSPWEPEGSAALQNRVGSSSRGGFGNRSSQGSNAGGGWGGGTSAVDLPTAARPGSSVRLGPGGATGASGTGGGAASVGRVRFEVEQSPALTPTWKSTSWARQKKAGGAAGGGEEGAESPVLGEGGDDGTAGFDEALK